MKTLLFVFILIVVVGFILELFLDLLNLKHRKKPIPDILADVYPPDRYTLQQQYEVETTRFSYFEKTLNLVITIIVLYLGLFGELHRWLTHYGFNPLVITLLFFGIIAFIIQLFTLPFSVYDTFVIEEKYGFNRTTVKLFIADIFRSLLLSVVIGGGLLALITWIFYQAANWFWIVALVVLLAFSLIANALYSRVIVPLFNKQKPLEEGYLLDSIKDFALKTNFPISKVFIIDGSKRSTKSNAYFSGFGKNRRVVLYDTLIEKMSHDEILAVLAHEIGHFRKHHIWINMAIGAVQMCVFLYIFNQLSTSSNVSFALGYNEASEPIFHLSLIGFAILFSPIEILIGLFSNRLSRSMEYQADSFAAIHGLSLPLISGLKRLSAENLSNLTPHPAYVFVNYSHPTLLQRIIKLIPNNKK